MCKSTTCPYFGVSNTFKTSFTFSVSEVMGVVYVYGFCGGNAVHVAAGYQRPFPNRRIPTRNPKSVYSSLPDIARCGYISQR
jgi:hypothetical protein